MVLSYSIMKQLKHVMHVSALALQSHCVLQLVSQQYHTFFSPIEISYSPLLFCTPSVRFAAIILKLLIQQAALCEMALVTHAQQQENT